MAQYSAVIENRVASVAQMFRNRVRETPDREAYRYPEEEDWVSRSWQEVGERVTLLAAGLIALGIEPEQRVAIASGTRYEWILADLAVMCTGAATTTVYPSTIPGEVAFILADSQSRVVFAEDDHQIAKLREHRDALASVTAVVTFDGAADDDWVISLDRLAELGAAHLAQHPDAVGQRTTAIQPHQLATLIYTSGTTGRPKGVRLRHSSWTYEGVAIAALGVVDIDDLQYLWLPLANVSRRRRQGRPVPWHLVVRHRLADKLVFAKVRDRFGGRLRFFLSGSAALSSEVAEWFHAAGILVLEGYGLTESSAGSLLNRPDRFEFGTVGLPVPGH